MSLESQYLLPILSSEFNKESYFELLDRPFLELDEYKAMLDILTRGKVASTLDNMPQE